MYEKIGPPSIALVSSKMYRVSHNHYFLMNQEYFLNYEKRASFFGNPAYERKKKSLNYFKLKVKDFHGENLVSQHLPHFSVLYTSLIYHW